MQFSRGIGNLYKTGRRYLGTNNVIVTSNWKSIQNADMMQSSFQKYFLEDSFDHKRSTIPAITDGFTGESFTFQQVSQLL